MAVTSLRSGEANLRPLYVQVKDTLTARIQSGTWVPGQLLPSEMHLAAELGVSQGTVRKALDAMADASLIERQQGRGTFVNEHTAAQVLFRYFRIYDNKGERVIPGVGDTRIAKRTASTEVANSLSLKTGANVLEINRVRTQNGRPFMTEVIYLPQNRFIGLDEHSDVPNTLYDLFQKDYGVTVAKVSEDLTPVLATKAQAKRLGVNPGTPLMKFDRVAYDLESRPIERRVSYGLMNGLTYRAELS